LFCILFAACFLTLMLEENYYDKIVKEKQRVESGLIKAVENAAKRCATVIYESTERKQQEIERSFFDSLYVALGIFEDKEQQEQVKLHVPLIVLAEEDGISLFYIREVWNGDTMELQHIWTDKRLFSFTESLPDETKKAKVAKVLEDTASKIITEHNYIAKQYGIEYDFFVPRFLQNTSEKLEFPMLFVVFQGWPLTEDGAIVYENCVDAGVYLKKREFYAVELPGNLTKTICYYHKADCSSYLAMEKKYQEILVTEDEAIRAYGAFPCKNCIP